MPKRKLSSEEREWQRSDYKSTLQSSRVKDLPRGSMRSVSRTDRILGRLSEYRDTEIAAELGISRQKYTAIKHRADRLASREFNDLLDQALKNLKTDLPQYKAVRYTVDTDEGRETRKTQTWVVPESWIHKNMPQARNIKPGGFASERSAMNWLGNVGGAAEYFAVVRKRGKRGERFFVYDIRNASEYKNRGNRKEGSEIRAQKLLNKYVHQK